MNGKKIRNGAIALVSVIGLAVGLAACSSGDDKGAGGGSEGGEAKLKDTYTIATDNSFVPFEFEENGKQVGFDMDVIEAIADESGFKIDLKTTNFDGIIPGLQTGTFDAAIAGISITEERKKAVDYTNPYFRAGVSIAVPVDDNKTQSLDDLKGKKVATRLGSAPLSYIEENQPEIKPLPFDQLDQVYLSVENGTAAAAFYDGPNVAYYVANAGKDKLKIVGDSYDASNWGIAVAKGNEDLVKSMNASLKKIMEDGRYAEIYKKWFDAEPDFLDELLDAAQ